MKRTNLKVEDIELMSNRHLAQYHTQNKLMLTCSLHG